MINSVKNQNSVNREKPKSEKGIAVFLALLMLLVFSVLAVTISTVSNMDFQRMVRYKRGQEAFVSAERCVGESRLVIEIEGYNILAFMSATSNQGFSISMDNGAVCRTGDRKYKSSSGPIPFLEFDSGVLSHERPIENTSVPSGNVGGVTAVALSFNVMGKDSRDEDKDDTDDNINTGTELKVGIEAFVPGGAGNIY